MKKDLWSYQRSFAVKTKAQPGRNVLRVTCYSRAGGCPPTEFVLPSSEKTGGLQSVSGERAP